MAGKKERSKRIEREETRRRFFEKGLTGFAGAQGLYENGFCVFCSSSIALKEINVNMALRSGMKCLKQATPFFIGSVADGLRGGTVLEGGHGRLKGVGFFGRCGGMFAHERTRERDLLCREDISKKAR